MKKTTLKKMMLGLATMILSMGILVACGNNSETGKNTETQKEEALQLLSESELDGVTFKRGDVFADMSVTATDGTTYKISELLKEKKAVVLNFWFINCGPCRMEFPYMQEAYNTYKDDLEILAVNPTEDTSEKIADYKNQMELVFPMAKIGEEWIQRMQLEGYPTTVVIDRYGKISFMHVGMITNVEDFNKIFEFFTADDYEHTVIRNISDIK